MGKLSLLLSAAALSVGAALGSAQIALADVGPSSTLGPDGAVFANVSISVADLDKSTAFYKAMGFEAGDVHPLPAPVAKLLGSKNPNAKLEIRFMKREGIVLELIHFAPAPAKKASDGAAGQLGLSHIAFRVDNVDRIAKLVKDNGGTTIDASRTKLGPMEILFVTDPDGTHIEIAGPAPKS